MTHDKKRIMIAIASGWKRNEHNVWINPKGGYDGRTSSDALPDYLNDLNAMHEAENSLDNIQWDNYIDRLKLHLLTPVRQHFGKPVGDLSRALVHTPAAQRAEAFLKTIVR